MAGEGVDAVAPGSSADARARAVEEQLTDEERFSLLVSVMGVNDVAVAAANPSTIVVLETGNPVAMPWRDRVRAIVEAWYPGQAGGQAIAEILTGAVNPSGRLLVTFPASLAETPRPDLPGLGTPWGTPVTIEYTEGAEIGYRWFARQHEQPLYPFGHRLSYTTFDYGNLQIGRSASELVLTADTLMRARQFGK